MRIDSTYQFQNPRGFLVLEGVNGAGKSTLLSRLMKSFARSQKEVIQTREPGGTQLGSQIRSLVLEASEDPPHHLAELFLFAADRAEHVSKLIEPSCKSGKLVVSDRFYYSTTAFQGFGRKLNLDTVNMVNKLAVQGVLPDLVVLLDLDPKVGLSRKLNNPEEEDKFEQEELDFHTRLRNGFLELSESCTEPFLVVDASRSSDEVFEQVNTLVERWVQACNGRGL